MTPSSVPPSCAGPSEPAGAAGGARRLSLTRLPLALLRHAVRQPLKALAVVALLAVIVIGLGLAGLRAWAHHLERSAREAIGRRDYDRAQEQLQAALRLRPHSPDLLLLRARLTRMLGQYDQADRALDAARQYGASAEAVSLERGLLRVMQGQMTVPQEVALRNLVNAGHPDTVFILEALTQAYTRSYRLKDARDCLDVWLQERPDDYPALMARGWVFERQLLFDRARDDYRRAAQVAPDPTEAELRLGQALLELGDNQAALPVFQALAERHPNHPAIGLGLVQSHLKLAQLDEAQALLDRLLADHPREAPLLLERGNLALQQGDPEAAEPWLRKAAELLPHDYQTNYVLWQCLRQRGKHEEAKQVDARVRQLQEDAEKMRALTDQLQGRPTDASLRLEIARIFLRNGEKREGLLWLQAALQLEPQNRAVHRALARYYEEKGDHAAAAPHRAAADGAP